MDNDTFWQSVRQIIADGFTPEGLDKLEYYAEEYIDGRFIFDRFLPKEQSGCAKGGSTHVIATIIAGAEVATDSLPESLSSLQRELQSAALQAQVIERWAKKTKVWLDNVDVLLTHTLGAYIAEGGEAKVFDNGPTLIKSIGLDYFLHPIHALDRVSLHNAYFPETALTVIGFGKNQEGEFRIIVEQTFIEGRRVEEIEIEDYATQAGFTLRNKKNWTYTTPNLYLSDLHDENVILGHDGIIYVIDCDIRLNTPDLKLGGQREFSNRVTFFGDAIH